MEIENNIIEKVYPRKNVLIRPYVSNIDILIIMVAKVPKPDWVLVEKLLLNCYKQKITPIICINKIDLMTDKEIEEFESPYLEDVKVVKISALKCEGFDELLELISGNVVCFAGQSAVGKTSLCNELLGMNCEIGELSKRIERGKNTTRQIEIYRLGDAKVVDTCGFSILTAIDIKYDELLYYYQDYIKLSVDCKYPNCTHTTEPNCGVRKAVESGIINKDRYDRYVTLYKELKENWRKKYE